MNELIKWIKESKRTVFFSGAGVSTESGLKDFRSKDGLYHMKYKYPPEEILSHSFFINNTEEFYKFYKENLNSLKYKPNIVHRVLKEMEEENLLRCDITQNIDGFDKEIGIKNVIELHGTIKDNYCLKCHKHYDAEYVFNSIGVPRCKIDNGIIKPDVVLYEEQLKEENIKKAIDEIERADLLIIGGTSLNVYPSNSFIRYFRGKHLVLINKEKTSYDSLCDLTIYDSLGKVFKEISDNL